MNVRYFTSTHLSVGCCRWMREMIGPHEAICLRAFNRDCEVATGVKRPKLWFWHLRIRIAIRRLAMPRMLSLNFSPTSMPFRFECHIRMVEVDVSCIRSTLDACLAMWASLASESIAKNVCTTYRFASYTMAVNVGSNHKSASSVLYRIVAERLIYLIQFFDRRCARKMNRNLIFRFFASKQQPIISSCKQTKYNFFDVVACANCIFFFYFSLASQPMYLLPIRSRSRLEGISTLIIYFLSFEQRNYRMLRDYHFSSPLFLLVLRLFLFLLSALPLSVAHFNNVDANYCFVNIHDLVQLFMNINKLEH